MGVLRRLASLFLFATSVGVATAHEVGGSRFNTPIPLPLLYLGAGVTVAATAVWLGRGGTAGPKRTATLTILSENTVRSGQAIGRLLFAILAAVVVYRGVVGRQVAVENLATVLVWPLWFKGLALVAVVIGSPWLALFP